MSRLLGELAVEVGVSERTLRRAVAEGSIRADRVSPYKLRLPVEERSYVRTHWSLIGRLRSLLRTEPGVECAVLFGSVARGEDTSKSDVDIAVWMRPAEPWSRSPLRRRLEAGLGRRVELIDARVADRHPSLLQSVLRDGRVLVDRQDHWAELRGREPSLRRRAQRERRQLTDRAEQAREFFAERGQPTVA